MTEWTLAAVLGLLFAGGTFLVLRRNLVRVVWGVAIVSQTANVFLVTMGGLSGRAPILAHHGEGAGATTDPLVQALVLTAIVIGFGTTAFALVLSYRVYQEHNTIDVSEIVTGRDDGAAEAADRGETEREETEREETEREETVPEDAQLGQQTSGVATLRGDGRD